MKATSESSSNLGSPISMRDVLIRVWDQGYQSPHFRRSRFRPDDITFRITIACRQFPYSAAFTTNINWKKSRLEKFRMSYLRSTGAPSLISYTVTQNSRLFEPPVLLLAQLEKILQRELHDSGIPRLGDSPEKVAVYIEG